MTFGADLKKSGLSEKELDKTPSLVDMLVQVAVLIILAPLAVFALWPALPAWFIPKYFADRAEDRMFSGTFLIALNALFIFPVFGLITFIITWMKASLLAGIVYVVLFPALCLFEWAYAGWVSELIRDIKALKGEKSGLLERLRSDRRKLFSRIDNILGK